MPTLPTHSWTYQPNALGRQEFSVTARVVHTTCKSLFSGSPLRCVQLVGMGGLNKMLLVCSAVLVDRIDLQRIWGKIYLTNTHILHTCLIPGPNANCL